jgi:hypothetical protein
VTNHNGRSYFVSEQNEGLDMIWRLIIIYLLLWKQYVMWDVSWNLLHRLVMCRGHLAHVCCAMLVHCYMIHTQRYSQLPPPVTSYTWVVCYAEFLRPIVRTTSWWLSICNIHFTKVHSLMCYILLHLTFFLASFCRFWVGSSWEIIHLTLKNVTPVTTASLIIELMISEQEIVCLSSIFLTDVTVRKSTY